RFALLEFGPRLWQLHKHDVAERLLRVVGDANRRCLAINFYPLVLFGVLAVVGISHLLPFLRALLARLSFLWPLIKWRRHYFTFDALSADFNLDGAANFRMLGRNVGQGNILFQIGRIRSAGDNADFVAL